MSMLDLGLALAAGSLTTLSPCVLPILPLVAGGAAQSHRAAPLMMGAGMASSFALIGLLVGGLGGALGWDGELFRTLGGVLLITLGCIMLLPALASRFATLLGPIASLANRAGSSFDTHSLPAAFALGATLGMVWSPCSGPLLASALTLVASEGGVVRGGVILGLFGIGAATPLVAVAYASRSGFTRWQKRIMHHIENIKKAFSLLIILMGLAVLYGWDKQLESLILQWLPDSWVNLTVRF